jgi:adenylate cyclase class 1
MHAITDMDNDKEIIFVFYPIKKTSKGRYFIELHDKPKVSNKHNYFDIKVIGNIANINNDSFYLYCHDREFSNLEFGNYVLREAVRYILQKRQGGERYPIYITDIDYNNVQPNKYKRIQTIQLLNQKKIIEEKLNLTLKEL